VVIGSSGDIISGEATAVKAGGGGTGGTASLDSATSRYAGNNPGDAGGNALEEPVPVPSVRCRAGAGGTGAGSASADSVRSATDTAADSEPAPAGEPGVVTDGAATEQEKNRKHTNNQAIPNDTIKITEKSIGIFINFYPFVKDFIAINRKFFPCGAV
jgi:hypothetical protein